MARDYFLERDELEEESDGDDVKKHESCNSGETRWPRSQVLRRLQPGARRAIIRAFI
jgi:hypothetical protein